MQNYNFLSGGHPAGHLARLLSGQLIFDLCDQWEGHSHQLIGGLAYQYYVVGVNRLVILCSINFLQRSVDCKCQTVKTSKALNK